MWSRLAFVAVLGTCVAGVARADSSPADLAIVITGPRSAELATAVNFRLAVQNRGGGAAEQPKVRVALPAGVRFVRPMPSQTPCLDTSGAVVCTLSRLPAPGDSGQLTETSFLLSIRSDGFGERTLDASVESEAPDPNTDDNAARTAIRFYALDIGGLRTSPFRPVPGRWFVASGTLVRSDTRAPLTPRLIRCFGAVVVVRNGGGPQVQGKGTIRRGRVWCSWVVPATAHGKLFRGVVVAGTHPGGMQTKFFFWRRVG